MFIVWPWKFLYFPQQLKGWLLMMCISQVYFIVFFLEQSCYFDSFFTENSINRSFLILRRVWYNADQITSGSGGLWLLRFFISTHARLILFLQVNLIFFWNVLIEINKSFSSKDYCSVYERVYFSIRFLWFVRWMIVCSLTHY